MVIRFPGNVAPWRREQLAQGMVEIAVDGEVGIQAVALADFHADPADRLIVATALRGHVLATADKKTFDWTGDVIVLDARRWRLPVTVTATRIAPVCGILGTWPLRAS